MTDRAPTPSTALEGTLWRLSWLVEADGARRAVPEGVRPTARFAEARVVGSGGCNRYNGGYDLDGQSMTLGPIASTMMACPEPAMSVEIAFLDALGRAASWRIAGSTLELRDAGSLVLLEFAAVDEPSLTGTVWSATGVNDERGGVRSVAAGTSITADFDEDGRVTGSSGCNRYRGPYRTDGHAITVGALAVTRMACPEPQMEQETRYLAALGRATVFAIDDDRLELRDEVGALQVAFEATRPGARPRNG